MFPRSQRLRSRNEIQGVIRSGTVKKIRGGLVIHVSPAVKNRCAVVIGRKFSPKAVLRNRQRRVLTEALWFVLDKKTQKYDIVVNDRTQAEMVSYKDAKEEFERIFEEVSVKQQK
jgi:ribonuclease P protein component